MSFLELNTSNRPRTGATGTSLQPSGRSNWVFAGKKGLPPADVGNLRLRSRNAAKGSNFLRPADPGSNFTLSNADRAWPSRHRLEALDKHRHAWVQLGLCSCGEGKPQLINSAVGSRAVVRAFHGPESAGSSSTIKGS